MTDRATLCSTSLYVCDFPISSLCRCGARPRGIDLIDVGFSDINPSAQVPFQRSAVQHSAGKRLSFARLSLPNRFATIGMASGAA